MQVEENNSRQESAALKIMLTMLPRLANPKSHGFPLAHKLCTLSYCAVGLGVLCCLLERMQIRLLKQNLLTMGEWSEKALVHLPSLLIYWKLFTLLRPCLISMCLKHRQWCNLEPLKCGFSSFIQAHGPPLRTRVWLDHIKGPCNPASCFMHWTNHVLQNTSWAWHKNSLQLYVPIIYCLCRWRYHF